MRFKIVLSLPADLVDYSGKKLPKIANQKIDGLACCDDSVLNYFELDFAQDCQMRGGHPRLVTDDKQKLSMTVELEIARKLKRAEMASLKEDLLGQLYDGIGAGCFDQLSTVSGASVVLSESGKPKCSQCEGKAWQPRATTEKGNEKRRAALQRWVEKSESKPASKAAPKAGKSNSDSRSKAESKKKVDASKETQGSAKSTPKSLDNAASGKKPNYKKLFRLLDKVERDQLFDQIKQELENCGNDLSHVSDGEIPYMNFNEPKLLRLLLKAGLPAESLDVKGHSLLVQAAVSPKSIQLLLDKGVDVNRVCKSHDDSTALIRAARLGKRKSVELLLANGAKTGLKNQAGKIARDLVDKYARDKDAIVNMLR